MPLILAHRGSSLPWLVDDRASYRPHQLWCAPTRYSASRLFATVPPASCVPPPPEGHQVRARKRCAPRNTILNQPYRRRVSIDRLSREDSQLVVSLESDPGPTPAGKTHTHTPKNSRSSQLRIDWLYRMNEVRNGEQKRHKQLYFPKYFMAVRKCIHILFFRAVLSSHEMK